MAEDKDGVDEESEGEENDAEDGEGEGGDVAIDYDVGIVGTEGGWVGRGDVAACLCGGHCGEEEAVVAVP